MDFQAGFIVAHPVMSGRYMMPANSLVVTCQPGFISTKESLATSLAESGRTCQPRPGHQSLADEDGGAEQGGGAEETA